MILPVHERLRERLLATLQHLYQVPPDALPQLPIEYPPKRELGDLATPVAFELARRLRKAPRAIAQELAAALGPLDGVARVEAAPNGYLNIFLDRVAFVEESCHWGLTPGTGPSGHDRPKAIVEHTAINPNKAAHIGHLRNSALGDTLVRVQRFRGVPVEVQNYIDDTGVQVADVVVGFRELEGKTLEDIRAHRRLDAVRLLLLGSLRARHRVVRRGQGAPRRFARPRCTTSSTAAPRRRHCRVHRRTHRPLPPEDDGAAEHRTTTC